jgi:antitoxin MazE
VIAKVQKWGNSLAVRIPRSVAADARLSAGESVELTLEKGTIVIVRARPRFKLEELLRRVNRRNRHGEVPTGDAVGQEVW